MFEGYKTYFAAFIVALAACGMMITTGVFDWEALALLAGALGLVGLRDAMTKKK